MSRLKRLRKPINLILLLILTVLHFTPAAQAQYGSPGGSTAQPQETPQEGEYDYVADVEYVWKAEYGAEVGSGDWRYYRNPLYDAAYEEQIGWADGYCIQSAPGEWANCTWSLYTDTWTLSAHGIYDETTGDNWFAISGGTGEYADVHGYLHWADNDDGSQHYYTVEPLEYTYYEPLSTVAKSEGWYETYWYEPAASYANVWYWHDPLYDETGSGELGASNGYCVVTAPNKGAECTWTAWGEGWALSASGTKYDEGESWLSITGGYGDYAGATGTVSWETSADGSQHYYTYYFDYYPTTLYKPYEVYVQSKGGYIYGDLPTVDPYVETAGDIYYWHYPLWDGAQASKIGWSDGYCVLTAPEGWSVCTLTLQTDYWTLTASGPAYETGSASTMAVTGGTGAYADVSGTIRVSPNGEVDGYGIELDLYVAPYTYWGHVGWNQVPEEDIPYWYTLGWNEYNWDASYPNAIPESEGRTWAELNDYEKNAATAVGYDESTWNPSSVRVPQGNPHEYWEQYDWDDLYISEQRLFGIWGWDEKSWPQVVKASLPATILRGWNELKPVEQGAATQLGYDEASWNEYVVRTPEGNVEEYWGQYDWDELYYGECLLFAYLGWTEESWSGDWPIPESKYRTWEELSWVEKGAASQLGYDAENWDATVLEH